MLFRKLIPIVLFLSGAILGKPLALGTVGLFAKAFLYFENGWSFSYGSIDWHEGTLIFKEVGLSEPDFSFQAKRVAVFLKERHLEVEKPLVEVRGIPQFRQGQGSDWTIEMKNGTFANNTLNGLHFSFERTWRHHLGRLMLQRRDSRIALEAIQEEGEIWVHADLHHFETDALKEWIDLKGVANGRVHLVFEGKECKRGSAHLDFRDLGYGQMLSFAEGTLDWEGEAGKTTLLDWLNQGRFRLKLGNAALNRFKGTLEKLKGDFSFTAGVGAKWEFSASAASKGVEFPIEWSGKAFLHTARPHWVESTFLCRDAQIFLKGEEEQGGFRWKGEGRSISAVEGTLLQSLYSLVDERAEQVEFEEGALEIQGEALFPQEWAATLRVEHLACRSPKGALSCRQGDLSWTSLKNGHFLIDGLSLQASLKEGKTIAFDGWQGKGIIEQGALIESSFEGSIENIQGTVTAIGTLEKFQLEARGKECGITLNSSWNGRCDFEIKEGSFQGLTFSGSGWVDPSSSFSLHLDRFHGTIDPLIGAFGAFHEKGGRIESVGNGFFAEGNLEDFDCFLQAKGELGSGIAFYSPILEKKGQTYSFDVRIETPTWDLARFYGTASGGECYFDPSRTHFLGKAVHVDSCLYDSEGLLSVECKVPVPWKSLLAAGSFWLPQTAEWISAPIDGEAMMDFSYTRRGTSALLLDGQDLLWKGEPFFFHCLAHQQQGGWHFSTLQIDRCSLSFDVLQEGEKLRLAEGRASWKMGLEAEFSGVIDSSFEFELDLPFLRLDLGEIEPIAATATIPLHGLGGILEGKGTFSRRKVWMADFDFGISALKAASLDWTNEGPIHLHYQSNTGLLCRGLDLRAQGLNLPFFSCKIGLLQFDKPRSLWILNQALFDLPPRILDLFPSAPPLLKSWNPEKEICFSAEIECPSDFSFLSCSIGEVTFPIGEEIFPLRNLALSFDHKKAQMQCELEHQGYPVRVSSQATFDGPFSGRLILEDGDRSLLPEERPLAIDWSYSSESGILIHEVEGHFGGMEASFHALDQGTTLIGSARIDFGTLSKIIPPRISQVFTDLSMGAGYELKGKLFLEKGISFRGLFTGKQIDLFGFRMRTLLSQFEFDPDRIRLYDLKISDSAGMLKIDELIASANGEAPWTISIPHLTILELRPSLLQRPGDTLEPAGPLVVREMRIDHFQGLLEDSKTYTAKGSLSFINSFRREHTVFDIPSDLLGRIVGLDLELLIPACGTLHYELKDGFFHLTSLLDSFSEGQRSEFFLVTDPAPTMDLDGNLHILVSMKQFVLFKLTEAFQILIDGKLDDPQFHLRKKRRFLGL